MNRCKAMTLLPLLVFFAACISFCHAADAHVPADVVSTFDDLPPDFGSMEDEVPMNNTLEGVDESTRRSVRGVRGEGWWSVKGAHYYDGNGNEVWFAGVQWSGLEVDGSPGGLFTRNYRDMVRQISSLGFNMIRLAFAGESLRPKNYPTNINYGINPDLQGLNSLGVMDKVISACTQYKIKVVLDYHRIYLTSHPEWGIWFDRNYSEAVWLNNWEMLAKRYANNPTVIGADLFNEVHNNTDLPSYPVWQKKGGEPYNWRTAVKRCSDRIQKVNKHILIFVEGMWYNSWWGGNLMYFTKVPPIPLKYPNKLAYSAHDYGPNVYDQPWYRNKYTFPGNLEGYWKRRWGYIVEKNIAPVWIGEWGSALDCTLVTKLTPRELIWAYKFRDYIRKLKLSHTWFNWGPDSRDTGGLLKDDWWNVWEKKMDLLKPIMHPNFGPSPGQ